MTTPYIPEPLNDVDFLRAYFTFEFRETCCLSPAVFLSLRSPLRAAARQIFKRDGFEGRRRFRKLFEPQISHDPVALKKFQKPSPPFIFQIKPFEDHIVQAGDQTVLEILFFGHSVALLGDFLMCLLQLGRLGLANGNGQFDIVRVDAVGEDGGKQTVWLKLYPTDRIAPPLVTVGSWLEHQPLCDPTTSLVFETPARLMVDGRPLRRPTFARIFPFMLRRVTSMLYAHADCELIDDAGPLLQAAAAVTEYSSRFQWQDWRTLAGNQLIGSIGGFTGNLLLESEPLEEVFWVIAVASLLGLGKGAAYGAGRFNITGNTDGRIDEQ